MNKINTLLLKAEKALGKDKATVMAFIDKEGSTFKASVNIYDGQDNTTQFNKEFATEQELRDYLDKLAQENTPKKEPMLIFVEYGLED